MWKSQIKKINYDRRQKIQKILVKVLHTVWHAKLTKKITFSFNKECKHKQLKKILCEKNLKMIRNNKKK